MFLCTCGWVDKIATQGAQLMIVTMGHTPGHFTSYGLAGGRVSKTASKAGISTGQEENQFHEKLNVVRSKHVLANWVAPARQRELKLHRWRSNS